MCCNIKLNVQDTNYGFNMIKATLKLTVQRLGNRKVITMGWCIYDCFLFLLYIFLYFTNFLQSEELEGKRFF